MKWTSPISGKPMKPVVLEGDLHAFRCEQSGGHYIPANSYMKWLHAQDARLPQLSAKDGQPPELTDSPQALICPESGTIMTRYRIGHGFQFHIDRSVTGGIWLDGGEWEALKNRNFHDEINLVFTAPWQKAVRNANARETFHATLKASLGEELLEGLTALRDELMDHPHKNLALAFLAEKTAPERLRE